MTDRALDPIILGHNPFFGVDHLSQERGNEKAKRFEDVRHIVDMIRHCDGLGVQGIMMSTHPRAGGVCEALEREPSLREKWRLYPLVPYIQKYVRTANEKGLVNVVVDTLAQTSLEQKANIFLRAGRTVLGRDLREALCLLIDVEMVPFRRLPLGAVFLHDALTDLALGLDALSLLELFRDHVRQTYKVPAGFATKNVPRLRGELTRLGWSEVLVMASFNAAGFYMNPSAERCAEAVREPGLTMVAMNTLASGYLAPDDAYRYLAQFPAIRSVVVGVSRKDHAAETFAAIRRHVPHAREAAPAGLEARPA